ncbi:MAG: MBL fold metallo-hydrolase [Candidatus Methanofastidiosa archaeon]|jgi:predicted metal-dependent RNase|nr:MBL fold metallo-hydrolase [Candidatus Methanofastidiosa archaeon]
MKVRWLGSAGEVGRSCVEVNIDGKLFILDCGIKLSGEGTYPDFSDVDISAIEAVIISHAHLDHSGYAPYLYSIGYNGPIYFTKPTFELSLLLQKDYIKVQGLEGEKPPFYNEDIRKEISHAVTLNYEEKVYINQDVALTFFNAGHILGSAQVCLDTPYGRLVYSGDIGSDVKTLEPIKKGIPGVDYLILESTYGKRSDVHPPIEEREKELIKIIKETKKKRGNVLIPVFAIDRAQNIMMLLKEARERGDISQPIFIEGLLVKANDIYDNYPEWMNKKMLDLFKKENPFNSPLFREVWNRKKIIQMNEPIIVVTTSGMMSGGPVIEYFESWAPDEKNSLVLVGYQVEDTFGRQILDGLREFKDEKGKLKRIKSRVEWIEFSAHADHPSLVDYVASFKVPPTKVFLDHGEGEKLTELCEEISKITECVIAEPMIYYPLGVTEKEEKIKPPSKITYEEKLPPIECPFEFIVTTPQDKILKDRAIALIENTKNELLITGYLDDSIVSFIIDSVKRGVKVKAIFRHITRPGNKKAFKILRNNGAEARVHRDCHARFLVSDTREALISSADLTRDSFYDHFEAGILTTDNNTIKKTRDFFYRMWDQSVEGYVKD